MVTLILLWIKGRRRQLGKVIKSLILREKEEQSPVLEWGESRGVPRRRAL